MVFSVLVLRYAGSFCITKGLHDLFWRCDSRGFHSQSEVWVVTGPEKLFFYLPFLYIQDRDIISFIIKALKISGNETEWTGFLAKTSTTILS